MIINEISKKSYLIAIARGKITNTPDYALRHEELVSGLSEETSEVIMASEVAISEHLDNYTEVQEELADVILVCFTELFRRGIDVEKLIISKLKYNEERINREG